jgi:serine/threonine protein kinase
VEFDAFGHYSLLKDGTGAPAILGHGAWGTVHKAFNNDLRCYAALRIIAHDAFPNDEERNQFVSEVRSASHIHHPTMASVFPLESIQQKYLYATEFCDGETLASRVARDGPLETRSALTIMSQVSAGLELASSAGLLHRNISAENIMLIQEDEEICVKVLDLALPPRSAAEHKSILRHDCEFSAPEVIAGGAVDVRSGVYSVGALFYYMLAGAESYKLVRAKSLANEEISFDDPAGFSAHVGVMLRNTFCADPAKRTATFAELRDAADKVLKAPRRPQPEAGALPARAEPLDSAAVTQDLPFLGSTPARVEVAAAQKPRGLVIPAKLLGSAQPGTVLRLKREGEGGEQLVVCARNRFRIGRSAAAGADLPTRFLPRSTANDTKTKRLSRIHVTAKCESGQILLFDGDSVTPSANGSTFDGKALSTEAPLTLLKAGDLQLAEVFSIRVSPHTFERGDSPKIANLENWKGPSREGAFSVAGSILFLPHEMNEVRVAVWLLTTAPFRSTKASPLDFSPQAAGQETRAVHYYRGCFWIEQRAPDSLAIDGLVLAPSEIAPLVTGQMIEAGGATYSIKIEEAGEVHELA